MHRIEHLAPRERQPEHRIVGRTVPVDQVIDDVAIGFERQHVTDDPDRLQRSRGQALQLRQRLEVAEVDRLVRLVH